MDRASANLASAGTNAGTLLDVLERRVASTPDRTAFVFLDGDGQEEASTSFRRLDERAWSIAAKLAAHGHCGKAALLVYPPGLDYIAALLGCMHAGCIAVPIYPPRPRHLDRFTAILADSQATVALTTSMLLPWLRDGLADAAGLQAIDWVSTDDDTDSPCHFEGARARGDSIAFLQYTSGSTGNPKGVVLTHGNLLHNLGHIARAMRCSSDSVGVFWLPPYHDMGLIGGILEPIYCGGLSILMSPIAFIHQPLLWLAAISRHRAAISGGPNFAYDYCVDKISDEHLQDLDLGSWTMAFNGSETVRAGTLRRFSEKFGRCGFRREAFYPCYGLAEATLFVAGGHYHEAVPDRHEEASAAPPAGGEPGATDPDLHTAVLCGEGLPDQRLLIVDPHGHAPCSAGVEGEIWIAGPSVARGYWRQGPETDETFHAYVKGTAQGPYLRTGDLGYLVGTQLRATGRINDLINLAGRKIYPQDVELSVQRSHAALRKACGAAFSVEEDGR